MARPASDIQQRIVRAARDAFLVDGVGGASLRGIARAAGTNLGMVYYYFPTKDDLFLAVVEEVYGALLADLERLLAEPGAATPSLFDKLYARLGALSEDESMMLRLTFREAMSTDSSRLARLFERFSRGHIPLLLTVIQGGVARGELRSDLPPFALVLATIAIGLFPQLLRRRLVEAELPARALLPDVEKLAKVLTRVLLEGIAAPEPRSP